MLPALCYLFALALLVGAAFATPNPHAGPYRKLSDREAERTTSSCRCFPGEACWPTNAEWAAFNKTVGGRLVATVPIAAVCHHTSFADYDPDACAALRAVWDLPQTHYVSSSSPMAPWFANASCDPFTDASAQCVVGAYVQYAVKAAGVADYQATLTFAAKRNIRLVIRNTGHDYFGKSTGPGGLALWTHFLKDISVVNSYSSPLYRGRAMKLGAGVQVFEAYKAADAAGVTIVAGDCDTVGVAGGYAQGGGHGPLNSVFGLGADQVLEWEVVTAAGEHLVATPARHADLYWALSGGGGGTYAAVLSATVRAHPAMKAAAANLTFTNTNTNVSDAAFYSAVKAFLMSMPDMADAGTWSTWLLMPGTFILMPVFGPDMDKDDIRDLLAPTLQALNKSGIAYDLNLNEFDSFYEAFYTMIPSNNITEYNIGGRLMPRSLVETSQSTDELVDALKFIVNNGGVVSGSVLDVSDSPARGIFNSVNPVWRTAIFDAVIGLAYNSTDFEVNRALQDKMTKSFMPKLEALTPNGGAYLNEGDFQQPDWQRAFYGINYPALSAIKRKYDPDDLFYGLTAVGSERWTQHSDGRLCRTGK